MTTVEITQKQYAEYQRLRSQYWAQNRKEAVLEELSNMETDEGHDFLDDEAEYRMESGHRDYPDMREW